RELIGSLRELLSTVGVLASHAAKADIAFANDYVEALYEFALIILCGIPESWNQPGREVQVRRGIRQANVHELYDQDLAKIVTELIPLCYRAEKMVHDWEQPIFGIIGMATASFAETGRESARLFA